MPEPVAMDQLDPAIERAAQYLANELPRLPEVKDSATQLVLALPPTLEHEANYPDGRLRSAMQALRNRLQEDPALRNSFVIISSTELESNGTLNSMQGDAHAYRDPLQRDADRTHAARYDPDAIYVLSGRFEQLTDRRAGQREYRLMFHVDHARSRRQVLQKEIDVRLRWDGERRQWLPA
jgi:hypothetical protein